MRRTIFLSIIVGLIILISVVFHCKFWRKIETIKLIKIQQELTVASNDQNTPISFGKVKALDIDRFGNLYVLDAENCKIYKFDVAGKLISSWGREGSGPAEFHNPRALCVVGDSLVYVFHDGRIEVTDINGKYKRRIVAQSVHDVKVASDGRVIYNFQNQSLYPGHCFAVYTPNSMLISNFRNSIARKYKTEMADVGFMDLNSKDEIIYFQAFLDSIFVYDLNGKLLSSYQQNLGFQPEPLTDEKQVMFNEDIFVDNEDHVFVLRVFREDQDEGTFIKQIDEYDQNLKLIRKYELPEPITLSIGFNLISPWYHKFAKRDKQFLFFVSKPTDHLEVYVPENLQDME
jgi:hypothetical protein